MSSISKAELYWLFVLMRNKEMVRGEREKGREGRRKRKTPGHDTVLAYLMVVPGNRAWTARI